MKQMARRHCWWFKIDQDIQNMSKSCKSCQEEQASPRLKFQNWPVTNKPWERVHVDFAGPFWGNMWMILVDAHSKFPFVVKMANITAESTITALRSIFLLEGPPETLVSDNGTQFTATRFKEFCSQAGINHLTTAPFHPSSNGEAERFVRTFKSAMRKASLEGKNKDSALNLILFTYRTMPSTVTGKSPAEILHGRQPNTPLTLLHPTFHNRNLNKRKFNIGDLVYTKFFSGQSKWVSGTVQSHVGSMMYQVLTSRGLVKRHQNQLRLRHQSGSEKVSSPLVTPSLMKPECNDRPAIISLPVMVSRNKSHSDNINVNNSSSMASVTPPIRQVRFQLPESPGDHQLSDEEYQIPRPQDTTPVPRRSHRTRKPIQRYSPS